MKRSLREVLENAGVARHLLDHSPADLIQRWDEAVGALEPNVDRDEFLNDLDLRRIIGAAREQFPDEVADCEELLADADLKFLASTQPVLECVWGAENAVAEGWNPVTHWFYWREPRLEQAESRSEPQSSSNGLCELVLIVSDLARSIHFYQQQVGLVTERVSSRWGWFWSGEPNSSARIAVHTGSLLFEERSPLPEGARFGRIHFAIRVPKQDLSRRLEPLRRLGTTIFGPVELDWMNADSNYFYDPDGNLLEFWTPRA